VWISKKHLVLPVWHLQFPFPTGCKPHFGSSAKKVDLPLLRVAVNKRACWAKKISLFSQPCIPDSSSWSFELCILA
jgi:hypothetical protein